MKLLYIGSMHMKLLKPLGIKLLAVICGMSLFASLFGCNKKPEYPFDKEKAYYYSRQGVVAGGGFHLNFNPEGVVEYYNYVTPPPENECGMRDRGADIYFVGLKEGKVEVIATFEYPTCEDEEYTFTLNVDNDLCVTRLD